MTNVEKIHRRSAGRRPPRPQDKRRQYRAVRESKAFAPVKREATK